MLKNSIEKTAFDVLPDVLKGEYKEVANVYVLQHDEDTGALKRAKDREKVRADELATELAGEKNAHAATRAAATQAGSPLEIATKAKKEALDGVAPTLERAKRLETRVRESALATAATTLAGKIGGEKNKNALLPHIEKRLEVTLSDDDQAKIVVKSADGKASELTLDALEKEIRGNKDLASLVVVSTGSGAAGPPTRNGVPAVQLPASSAGKTDFNTMTMDERKAYIQSTIMVEGQ